MRKKKALLNNISAASLQIITLLFGLIIPRYMIALYGSEINGLISSSKQLISYLQYLEVGLSATLIYNLYKPLASRDYDDINPLVTRAKKEYEKIGLGYLIGVILLSIIYPILLRETIGYGFMFIIILLIGANGVLDLITVSKYRVLLTADQRYYIVTLTSIIILVLQNVTSLLLLINNAPVLTVLLIPLVFFPLRSVILRFYIKRKYDKIDFKVIPSNLKNNSRFDAFISGLANTLNVSLPIVVVSLIVSLEMASVYSVYNMIFIGLTGIISIFTTGMSATFGNMFAKNEQDNLIKTNEYFEFIIFFILTVIYSIALAVTLPFIELYTKDIADINYIYPSFVFLFIIWSVIHNSRIPNQTMISASGNWKLGTKVYIIQIILLLVVMLILGNFYSINGILVGMIIASAFKTFSVMYIANKKILNTVNYKSVLRLFRIFIVMILTYLPLYFNFFKFEIGSIPSWLISSTIYGIWVLAITVIVNIILDQKVVVAILKKYIIPFFKKK